MAPFFSSCTLSLLEHPVLRMHTLASTHGSIQVAILYAHPAKVTHQGANIHLLGVSLNVNSLEVFSLAILSIVAYLYQSHSLSQSSFGFFFKELTFTRLFISHCNCC